MGWRERTEQQINRLLLAVGRADSTESELLALAGGLDPDRVVSAAQRHHVVSLLHDRLHVIPAAPRNLLDALARPRLVAQAQRHLLARALEYALHALEVPAIVLKGHALAQWYSSPLSRDFHDNDLLVRACDFAPAVRALEAAGLSAIATNWHGFLEYEVGEIPLQHRSTVIDLHWHVVATGANRRHFMLPTEAFLERSTRTRLGEIEIGVLTPEDTLLHLCVNAGLGGGRRLRNVLDVDAVIRSGRVDVDRFIERARTSRTERLCSAMLQRSRALVGTPVSDGFLRELAPSSAWLLANRLVDRSGSISRSATAGIVPGLLLGAGRATARATTAELARSSRAALAVRRGKPGLTSPEGDLAWGRQPEDGDIATHRQRYFDWVATMT